MRDADGGPFEIADLVRSREILNDVIDTASAGQGRPDDRRLDPQAPAP
jgi:hypothetical protein